MNSQANPPATFDIRAFGATADGRTNNANAIQAALNACYQGGGGTVTIPAGQFVTGPIFLHSHITLFLEAGACLLGSQEVSDYPVVPGRWEGLDQPTYAPLIGGNRLDHHHHHRARQDRRPGRDLVAAA